MALVGGEGSAACPSHSLPPGKTRYPLYRKLGGPQGRSGQVRKISPLLGFDPRTVQPVASRYTVYTTRPTMSTQKSSYICFSFWSNNSPVHPILLTILRLVYEEFSTSSIDSQPPPHLKYHDPLIIMIIVALRSHSRDPEYCLV